MKELVYINKSVNVNYQAIYTRAKDYFHRHGVEIDFEFVESDYKNLSYRVAKFPQGERVILQPTMSNIVPIDPVYDFTSFVFNGREFPPPNIPTGYCYPTPKGIFIDINLDDRTPDANYLLIIHEKMHALVYLANLAGFNVPQIMDSYYLNDQPENSLSNFGQQWTLLKPFIASISPVQTVLPQVTITRHSDDGIQTLGILVTNKNNFSYKTLERPWNNNVSNISCIPKGQYQVKFTRSLKFPFGSYEVQNVSSRSGIRFHKGNFFFDVEGCILLGTGYSDINHDGHLDIINSTLTIRSFEALLNKQPFQLEIL